MKLLSLLAFLLMGGGVGGLLLIHSIFSPNIAVIAVQAIAFVLMVWARASFGMRSFHATANPTEGGLVTTGPYAFIRHPIYTAACLFVAAGGLAHISAAAVILIIAVISGAVVRMLVEERLIVKRYPEYAGYASRTKRMIPYLF